MKNIVLIIVYNILGIMQSIPNKPLSLFVLISFCVHRQPIWLLCLLLSIGIESLVHQTVRVRRATHYIACLHSFFSTTLNNRNSYKITEIDSTKIIGDLFGDRKVDTYCRVWKSLKKGGRLSKMLKKLNSDVIENPVRIFINNDPENQLFIGPFVYSSAITKTYIFLNDVPEKLSPIQRFTLLHEFGHATETNNSILSGRYITIIHSIIAFVIIVILLDNFWLLIPLIIILYGLSSLNWDTAVWNAEIHADAWGISTLPNIQERKKVVDKLISIYSTIERTKETKKEMFSRLSHVTGQALDIELNKFQYRAAYPFRLRYLKRLSNAAIQKMGKSVPGHLGNITVLHLATVAIIILCSIYSSPTNAIILRVFYTAFSMLLMFVFTMNVRYNQGILNAIKMENELKDIIDKYMTV